MRKIIKSSKCLLLIFLLLSFLSGCFPKWLEVEDISNDYEVTDEQAQVIVTYYEELKELYEEKKVYTEDEESELRSEITELSINEEDESLQSVYFEIAGLYLIVSNMYSYSDNKVVREELAAERFEISMNIVYDFLVEHCNYEGKVFSLDD